LLARHRLLVDAKVAAQVRAAELVVEGGAAERAVEHDLQRAGDVLGLAVALLLPRLVGARQVQVRDAEARSAPPSGREPRPVAPSSRISPPAPVDAPGNGEIAVGWLCVSTFISAWTSSRRAE
jgi:hypothetical protein